MIKTMTNEKLALRIPLRVGFFGTYLNSDRNLGEHNVLPNYILSLDIRDGERNNAIIRDIPWYVADRTGNDFHCYSCGIR